MAFKLDLPRAILGSALIVGAVAAAIWVPEEQRGPLVAIFSAVLLWMRSPAYQPPEAEAPPEDHPSE